MMMFLVSPRRAWVMAAPIISSIRPTAARGTMIGAMSRAAGRTRPTAASTSRVPISLSISGEKSSVHAMFGEAASFSLDCTSFPRTGGQEHGGEQACKDPEDGVHRRWPFGASVEIGDRSGRGCAGDRPQGGECVAPGDDLIELCGQRRGQVVVGLEDAVVLELCDQRDGDLLAHVGQLQFTGHQA